MQKSDQYMFDEFYAPIRNLIENCGGPGTDGRPRPVFMDSDAAFIFVTHNDVCHNTTAGKEMSNWTADLDLKWVQLINHALLFPRAAIICGGPASVMGWSDYRYDKFTEGCIAMSLAAGVFAFDGKEYFSRMEMSHDGWHWSSTEESHDHG